MTLRTRLRAWREFFGMSQADVGELAGLSAAAISQWESGSSSPSQENLEMVVKGWGLTMAEFYGPVGAEKGVRA